MTEKLLTVMYNTNKNIGTYLHEAVVGEVATDIQIQVLLPLS